jgi:hypothetical protein
MRPADLARECQATAGDWLERELTTKRCASCGETKPLDDFGLSTKNAGRTGKGRATNCRQCEATRLRAHRATRTAPASRPLIVPPDHLSPRVRRDSNA